MRRREALDYMNAAGCLLVILIHVLSVGVGAKDLPVWLAAAVYLPWRFAAFAVPMFLYTAAIKVAGQYGGRSITWGVYLRYCLGRVRKILVPYILWSGVYYAYHMYRGVVSGTLWEFCKYLITGNLSAPLYFVVLIMQFYFTMPLWLRLSERLPAFAGLSLSLFVTLCMGQAQPLLAGFGIPFKYADRLCLTYCVFWMAGLYAGKYYDQLVPALRQRRTRACCGAAAAVCCVLSFAAARRNIALADAFSIRVASYLLSIILLHALCLGVRPGFLAGILQKIHRASFAVYLSHCLFLSILENFLAERGIVQLAVTLPLRGAVCYTLPFLTYWLFARLRGFLSRFTRGFQNQNIKE